MSIVVSLNICFFYLFKNLHAIKHWKLSTAQIVWKDMLEMNWFLRNTERILSKILIGFGLEILIGFGNFVGCNADISILHVELALLGGNQTMKVHSASSISESFHLFLKKNWQVDDSSVSILHKPNISQNNPQTLPLALMWNN